MAGKASGQNLILMAARRQLLAATLSEEKNMKIQIFWQNNLLSASWSS